MKIERKAIFEERELQALKTIANLNCSAISCSECPIKIHTEDGNYCVPIAIRDILRSLEINF